MSYDLILLLEEPSMKTVLEVILPKLIPENIIYICIAHEGKQDLAKSIPRKIRAFSFNPDIKFIIVHDQDSHDCKQLKADLLQLCQQEGKPETMIRIICHELESWFLGDLVAIEKAYGLKPQSLSKKQNQNKFRDPDRLNSAKEELRMLVSEYYPGTHSRTIAPHLSLDKNTSCSFHIFLDGIRKMYPTEPF
jgi:Domain of unknown function (DUF4276)